MDQPFTWTDDLIKYKNLRSIAQADDSVYAPPDAYEEMDFDDDDDVRKVAL